MMRPSYLTDEALKSFIASALAEDIGEGDHSALGAIPPNAVSKAQLLIKSDGILAGVELAQRIFLQHDPSLEVNVLKHDGESVRKGDIGFYVSGKARSILCTERLVLNCMQRMSGIATHARRLVKLIEGTQATVIDTRKTTPNFRLAEKWAVYIGGGKNHRFALYDMVMLKDNHVDIAGGIRPAIENTKAYLAATGLKLKIEVETRSLREVGEVLATGGVDVIMLDNMSAEEIRRALALINNKYKTEASGGITEFTLRQIAETGVDYISVGALTHSVKSLDLSLKVIA
jgi:nicotinate-nucleotide pyrophosphorylase (carboxylating)